MNTKFEAWKVRREILKSGVDFDFKRQGKNKYKEPEGDLVDAVKIKGLYHEENSYIEEQSDGVNTIRTKKVPKILVVYDDTSTQLKRKDEVEYNGKLYQVTGITDIQNWNVILDVSLEVTHEQNNEGSE